MLERDQILMSEQGYDKTEVERIKVTRYELKLMRQNNTKEMISFIASNIQALVKNGVLTIQIDHKSMLGNQTSDFQTHAFCIAALLTIGKRTASYPLCFEPTDSTTSAEFVPILEDVLQVCNFLFVLKTTLFAEISVP